MSNIKTQERKQQLQYIKVKIGLTSLEKFELFLLNNNM